MNPWLRWQYTLHWRRLLAEAVTNAANRILLKRAVDEGWAKLLRRAS